jgi:hypothetical protein
MAQGPGVQIHLGQDDQTLTLLVARRSSKVTGGQVPVADDARDALRATIDRAVQAHQQRVPRPYDPDAHLETGEYFHVTRREVEDSMGVLALIDRATTSPIIEPSDISERPQLFYAGVVGAVPEERLAFVTRSNPATIAKRGHFFTPKGGSLARIETPVLLFEDHVDLIVTATDIVINDQATFEQWFRDTPALQERVGTWVGSITAHLPIHGDGADRLVARCRESPRLRRLLYVIHTRGHLAGVSIARVRRHINDQGLDASKLVRSGRLVFDDADEMSLLKLLNEDLFKGGLTDEPFTVDRKSRRSQP